MIGGVLKERRLARGLDLERISSALKIKASYLKALEEEDFELFPADVYTIGYLRSYALYLGVSPEPLIEEFKALREKQVSEESVPSQSESKSSQQPVKITSDQRAISESRIVTKLLKPHLLILIVIFLIVGLIISSVFKTRTTRELRVKQAERIALPEPPPVIITSSDNTKSSSDIPASQSQASQVIGQKESKVINPQAPAPSPSSDKEGYTIMITAQELTWLKVESEEGVHDITMKPGDTVKYTSKKGFKLIIGNAGGIKLSLNGKDMGSPGKSGEVKIITLP